MSNEKSQRLTAFWILFALTAWVFSFRGFLTSKFELTSDALSYYDHTKFFIENLGRGVFPLWDPYWCNGSPNDFFLRRIGPLNPFYLIILVFKSVGIPYTLSYLWFLGMYYWGGMIAFYLLAMRIYQDRLIAYAGYSMLLFSALGTRLFDSYMMLVTVPLIWFFYFLVAFCQTSRKHFYGGMVLSLMILAGTYIPFYFLIILGLFLLFFAVIYIDQIPEIFRRYGNFFKANKILVLLSLAALFFSFIPIFTFFHDSTRGQVVFPVRHGEAGFEHALTVPHKTLDWGAIEDFVYSAYFSDLRMFKFAVVYVPFFSVVVLALGFAARISRRAIFIFLLGLALLCSIVPYGLPFYDFFYKHVFILKYFRNLHFFIWFFLIPLFVFLVMEHWDMFARIKPKNDKEKWCLLAYTAVVHGAVLLFVWYRKDAVPSTYMMIVLSLIFWSLMVLKKLQANAWGFALLTLTLLIQPLEAYHYFALKAVPHINPYTYDFSFTSLKLKEMDLAKPEDMSTAKDTLYYASKSYNFIYQNISNYALAKYLQNKFILVDHLELVDRDKAVGVLERHFLTDDNSAIVFKDDFKNVTEIGPFDPHPSSKPLRIDAVSDRFKVLDFNANHLKLAVDLPYKKFLVYNDSYGPYWHVSIDHHPSRLYEVNGAFKGVWVPAGKSVVEFSYGYWWQYMLNILPLIFALIFLAGIFL